MKDNILNGIILGFAIYGLVQFIIWTNTFIPIIFDGR